MAETAGKTSANWRGCWRAEGDVPGQEGNTHLTPQQQTAELDRTGEQSDHRHRAVFERAKPRCSE
ncbi:hypothetical protein DMI69_10900 [Escherichia coli]|nr:hypothetical protein [Escherichia coli]